MRLYEAINTKIASKGDIVYVVWDGSQCSRGAIYNLTKSEFIPNYSIDWSLKRTYKIISWRKVEV